mmetsp:Transcript_27128/g.48679  ORF Transcript_27128/g.48679 Transcript_27128/m.48679 type:complete len:318 (-) Transcript_27128:223-1176(-)
MAHSPTKLRRRQGKLSMTDLFELLQEKDLQILELQNDRLKNELSRDARQDLSDSTQLEELNSQMSMSLRDKDRHIRKLHMSLKSSQERNESKERQLKERFRAKTAEMKELTAKLRTLQEDTKRRMDTQVSRISSLMSQGEDKLRELVRYIEDLKLKHRELQASQDQSRETEFELNRLIAENDHLKHLTAHCVSSDSYIKVETRVLELETTKARLIHENEVLKRQLKQFEDNKEMRSQTQMAKDLLRVRGELCQLKRVIESFQSTQHLDVSALLESARVVPKGSLEGEVVALQNLADELRTIVTQGYTGLYGGECQLQ